MGHLIVQFCGMIKFEDHLSVIWKIFCVMNTGWQNRREIRDPKKQVQLTDVHVLSWQFENTHNLITCRLVHLYSPHWLEKTKEHCLKKLTVLENLNRKSSYWDLHSLKTPDAAITTIAFNRKMKLFIPNKSTGRYQWCNCCLLR